MEELQKAAQAIAAGNKAEANLLLARVIKADPNNVEAWILLSESAATPQQAETFLKRALLVDPDNEDATARLAAHQGAPAAAAPAEPAAQAESPAPPQAAAITPAPPAEAEVPAEPAATEVPVAAEAIDMLPETEADTVEEAAAATPVMPVSKDPFDFEAQAEAKTLPPWLAGEEVYLASSEAAADAVEEPSAQPEVDVPDWLKEEPSETWLAENQAEEQGKVLREAGDGTPPPEATKKEPPGPAPAGVRPTPRKSAQKKKSSIPQGRTATILEAAIVIFTIAAFLLMIWYFFGQ